MKGVAGPVLQVGVLADAVVAAIRELNGEIETDERGSYVRVLARGGCRVTRAAIEAQLGTSFRLPSSLEPIMPSFQGRIVIDEDEVRWLVEEQVS